MTRTLFQRISALAGVVLVVLIVAVIILSPDSGTAGNSASKILALNVSNSSAILGWTLVEFFIMVVFLVFASRVRSAVAAGSSSDIPAALVSYGAIGFVTVNVVGRIFTATLAYDAPHHPPLAVVSALFDASSMSSIVSIMPLAIFVLGASIAALVGSALPRPIGLGGVAVAAVALVSSGAVMDPAGGFAGLGMIAMLLSLLWIAATSIALARQSDEEPRFAAAPAHAQSLAAKS
ncbi:MAG: hypothetical protein PVSMB7_17400 [Chloroflexota bacterium]